jgi:ferredoxin
MPTVTFETTRVECLPGSNLRMVLLRARLPLYNSVAAALNCRGNGVCGTCAVRIEGEASPPTPAEQRRLAHFPHRPDAGLRLACQVSVQGDLVVTKPAGLFGQRPR